jgi:predicted molibdopterin-dependent oxidoreductase YjgC
MDKVKTEPETSDEDYPLRAILGSLRYHLGSGTRTGHSGRIKDFALKGEVEIAPEDGAALKLKEGDQVRIASAHGSISREVKLKTDLRPGLIFIPTAFHHNDVMNLIELTQLGQANSPGWKECPVKIEKLKG